MDILKVKTLSRYKCPEGSHCEGGDDLCAFNHDYPSTCPALLSTEAYLILASESAKREDYGYGNGRFSIDVGLQHLTKSEIIDVIIAEFNK